MADRDPVAVYPTILRDHFAPILSDRRAVLIGFLANQNCGDYAEWLGALKLLHELRAELAYTASLPSLDSGELARRAGQDAIFAVGSILSDAHTAAAMADVTRGVRGRIVISPQSIADAPVAGALITAFMARADIAVFARDQHSATAIEHAFGGKLKAALAPPLSFMLGPQQLRTEAEYDIVWIARTDRSDSSVEAAARLSSQTAEKLDLPEFPDRLAIDVVVRRRPPTVLLTDWSSLVFRSQEARLTYNTLDITVRAQAYLDRALHIVSLGRVVITDRIGAHVFCLLLGIPHVLCDEGRGSNRAFFDNWSRDAKACQFADTPAKAWSLARTMLHEIKGEE